jgi:hypothetical protein
LFPSHSLWSTRSAQRCSFSTAILGEKQHMRCSVNEGEPYKNMTRTNEHKLRHQRSNLGEHGEIWEHVQALF